MNADAYGFSETTSLKELYREVSEEKKTFKYFQEILSIQILKKICLDKKLYLPCFMDNRGRQYYSTRISPTFYVLFRHLYKFAEDRDFRFLEDSTFYKSLNKEMKEKMLIDGNMFENDDDYEKFVKNYGNYISIYKILEEYCKNDAFITKKSIIKYWKIIEKKKKKGS